MIYFKNIENVSMRSKLALIFLFLINISLIKVHAQQQNADSSMVNLPALPNISGQLENKQLQDIVSDAQQNKLQNNQQQVGLPGYDVSLSEVIPWRDGYGDPKDQNYQNLLKEQFPMSPEQIQSFRQTLDIYEKSVQNQVRNPAPVISTRNVSLDPGSTPLPIRISTGYISTLLFVDETGSPWPINSYAVGNPKSYLINWDKTSHGMFIQGLKPYSNTNLVVNLVNLPTPIILNLVSDQKEVDYRLDLRVPGIGPYASAPIITMNNLPSNDNVLMELIDGIPPERAKPLDVKGGGAKAWLLDDNELLIRTRLTILSPAYTNSMRSPDGMKVYRMPKTPLIMAARDGNTYQLTISGY